MDLKVVAIVPAAGIGKRFGSSEKKQFVTVADNPLLFYPLQVLHSIQSITEIIPVVRKEDMERCRKFTLAGMLSKIKKIAPGGSERQDSVYNALTLIQDDDLVLIHDGARPLVSPELIERLLQEIEDVDGVIPGIPVRDTLKQVDSQGYVLSTVRREDFWSIQTPQVFRCQLIKKAYEKAYENGFYGTDDAALVERIGGKVKVIPGDPLNIKVTTPEDMITVSHTITQRENRN
jgi:2-C-methyl-D-erythritol 4-phosphate cytidylyltransferase